MDYLHTKTTAMRNALCILLLAGAFMHSSAQTLTAALNCPVPGDAFHFHRSAVFVDEGPAGTDLTWDFAALDPDAGFSDATWVLPSETPFAAHFPDADLAYIDDAGVGYSYYRSSASALENLGVEGSFGAQLYTDPMTTESYPLSNGSMWADSFSSENDSLYGTTAGFADATGTLIMPYGTVANVLRWRYESELNSITTDGDILSFQNEAYLFSKPGIRAPLLSLYGTAPPLWLDGSAVGMEEALHNSIGMEISPVPAHGPVRVRFVAAAGELACKVVAANGTLVRTHQWSGTGGLMQEELDLSGLAPGLYTLRITDTKGCQGQMRLVVE